MPAKGSDMKRTRRDRGEMEEIMFKLFERQPNWTLKQLLHETDQPEVCYSINRICGSFFPELLLQFYFSNHNIILPMSFIDLKTYRTI